MDPAARSRLHLLLYSDADFNGDYTVTQRSTSAGATYLASELEKEGGEKSEQEEVCD